VTDYSLLVQSLLAEYSDRFEDTDMDISSSTLEEVRERNGLHKICWINRIPFLKQKSHISPCRFLPRIFNAILNYLDRIYYYGRHHGWIF
jgi:hypothetical protein